MRWRRGWGGEKEGDFVLAAGLRGDLDGPLADRRDGHPQPEPKGDPSFEDLDEIFAALLDRLTGGDDAPEARNRGAVPALLDRLALCSG